MIRLAARGEARQLARGTQSQASPLLIAEICPPSSLTRSSTVRWFLNLFSGEALNQSSSLERNPLLSSRKLPFPKMNKILINPIP